MDAGCSPRQARDHCSPSGSSAERAAGSLEEAVEAEEQEAASSPLEEAAPGTVEAQEAVGPRSGAGSAGSSSCGDVEAPAASAEACLVKPFAVAEAVPGAIDEACDEAAPMPEPECAPEAQVVSAAVKGVLEDLAAAMRALEEKVLAQPADLYCVTNVEEVAVEAETQYPSADTPPAELQSGSAGHLADTPGPLCHAEVRVADEPVAEDWFPPPHPAPICSVRLPRELEVEEWCPPEEVPPPRPASAPPPEERLPPGPVRGPAPIPDGLLDSVLRRRVALGQVRADYEARLHRSAELASQLLDLERSRDELRATLDRTRADLVAARSELPRLEALRDTIRSRGEAAIAERRSRVGELEEQCATSEDRLQRLKRVWEAVPDDIVLRTLWEKRREMDVLRTRDAQLGKRAAYLRADLRGILDFMMRVNIEAAGGPAPHLGPEDFLPKEVLEQLPFSEQGQAQVADLTRKYRLCMASSGAGSAAEDDAEEPDSGSAGSGTLSTRPASPSGLAGGGSCSEPGSSFRDEAALLRRRLCSEMQLVAATLSEDGGGPEREVMRAAAWGDLETMEEWLPLAREAALQSGAPPDPGLRGWTAWHAAAAHGQPAPLGLLSRHEAEIGSSVGEALDRRSDAGLVPLAIACLQGHAEVVRALLEARAPVDVCDSRGNTPLMWAAAAANGAEAARAAVELVLAAGADPHARNRLGHQVDASGVPLAAHPSSSSTARAPSAAMAASAPPSTERAAERRAGAHQAASADEAHELYFCVRAAGARRGSQEGFLVQAMGRLKPPVRDAMGFMRNQKARAHIELGAEEEDLGAWSDRATNFTHAGLGAMFTRADQASAPTNVEASRQVLVLTCERLMLFQEGSWALRQALSLAEVKEAVISEHSETVVLLRTRRRPDLVLDVPSRGRFLEELQIAISAARWPGAGSEAASGGGVGPLVKVNPDPFAPLLDGAQSRVGTLAYLEQDVFLLLPYAPASLLLAGPAPTAAFGFLDLQRRMQPRAAGAGVCWRWQRYFFILKGGARGERRLLWCHHPNAEQAVAAIPLARISQAREVDNGSGEHCFCLECYPEGPSSARAGAPLPVTLRARSAKGRKAWLSALYELRAAPG